LVCAAPPTRDTEIPALMAGRMPAFEEVGLEEDLAVGDRGSRWSGRTLVTSPA